MSFPSFGLQRTHEMVLVVAETAVDGYQVVARVRQEHPNTNNLSVKIWNDEQAVAVVEVVEHRDHASASTGRVGE